MTYSYRQNAIGYYSAHPLPSPEELAAHYANDYYQAPVSKTYAVAYDPIELDYKRHRNAALIALSLQHVAGDSLLDIGAGEGFAMAAANEAGLDVHGADFSSYGIEHFHPELVSKLTVGDAFDFLEQAANGEKRYSITAATNVLEHVIDPVHFLNLLRASLKPNGVIVITVPNDFSPLQAHLMETGQIDREFWFAPPEHLHYFTYDSFQALCSLQALEVVDVVSDFPVDWFLLNPNSNYIMNGQAGRGAHVARMQADLLLARRGMTEYLNLYRALAATGGGRNLTFVLRPR